MAASQAKIGYGTHLQYGDGGSPESFTTLAELAGEPQVSERVDLVEVTHMDSPNRFKEFIPGLREGQEVTFMCNLLADDPSQQAVRAMIDDATTRTWRVIADGDSPAPTMTFLAFLVGQTLTFPVGDKRSFEVTLKIAGAITYENL